MASFQFLVAVPKLFLGGCIFLCKACRECFGHIGIAFGIQKMLWAYRKCFAHVGSALGIEELLWARRKCFGHLGIALGRLEIGFGR